MTPTIAELAERACLRLITCERNLGKMRPEACVMRWMVADGRAPGTANVRESRCRDCEHGAARHAAMKPIEQRALLSRLGGRPRKPRRAPKPPVMRKCEGPGCEVVFQLHGAVDGNKRYHDDACRAAARALAPKKKRESSPQLPVEERRRCSDATCGEVLAIGQPCTSCMSLRAVRRVSGV